MKCEEWLEFAEMFKHESLPETIGGELLHLVRDDLALAKVIYGVIGTSALEWLKNYKSQYLEHKTPLQCIRQNRLDLLYPFLMAATATDGEREELKNNLLKLLGNIHINAPLQVEAIKNDKNLPMRKRALIAQILDEIVQEQGGKSLH